MERGRKSFYLSLGIHGALLFTVLVCSLFNRNPRELDTHVFEMVSIEPSEPIHTAVRVNEAAAGEEVQNETLQEVFEGKAVVVENVMSYEDFIKKEGKPKKVQPKKVKKEVLNAQKIKASLSKALQVDAPRSDAVEENRVSSLQAAYLLKLKRKIDLAWDKPKGVTDELRAQVVFRVLESGEIVEVRVIQTSGNSSFDASILDAFDFISRIDMPKEVANVYELAFSMGI